jgi:NADH:ubiquinone oxidoreductase subunit F (NADH-binding)
MARKSRKNLENVETIAAVPRIFRVGAYVRLSIEDKKKKGDNPGVYRRTP